MRYVVAMRGIAPLRTHPLFALDLGVKSYLNPMIQVVVNSKPWICMDL